MMKTDEHIRDIVLFNGINNSMADIDVEPGNWEKASQKFAQSLKIVLNAFNNWDDFSVFKNEIKANDLFVIITSRKDHVSHNAQLDKLPYYLSTYFKNNSFIILYPKQLEQGINMEDLQQSDNSLLGTLTGRIGPVSRFGNTLRRIFRKRG